MHVDAARNREHANIIKFLKVELDAPVAPRPKAVDEAASNGKLGMPVKCYKKCKVVYN